MRLRPFSVLITLHIAAVILGVIVLARQKRVQTPGREKIVVMSLDGVISMDKGSVSRSMQVDNLVEAINDMRDDEKVKALVLRINSPGGSVGAVQEIYSALKKFRSKGKFVVSSFGDVSASGGYYIACAGDRILCQPGTLTGSIGVILQLPNAEGLLQKIGLRMETIKSGSMKDSGSPFRPMTPEEKAYFSSVIEDAYNQFYGAVKDGRKLGDDALKPLADGRVFSGRMAVENKLADQLGDLEDAIELAKKLTGLENRKPQIIRRHEKKSFERLLDILSKTSFGPVVNIPTRSEIQLQYLLQ